MKPKITDYSNLSTLERVKKYNHIEAIIEGLKKQRERIQACIDEKAVDRAVQEVLKENERIQFGDVDKDEDNKENKEVTK
ncbi:MAG TPA: hypothetical protein VF220_01515 [Nitrososphaeraceae archaeon]